MTSFAEKVYRLLTNVPPGYVTTYKELGRALNCRGYRLIGQILSKNPYAPLVPCHRVVKSDGSLGGFKGSYDSKDTQEKVKLLTSEGIIIKNGKVVNFSKVFYKFQI